MDQHKNQNSEKNDFDPAVVVGAIVVFVLPLTVLIPGFSVWDVVPKFRVTRFHIIRADFTWPQLNACLITTLVIYFCIFLETRKRKLDDMVEQVLAVSQATDVTMSKERERQTAAMKACVELLDASTEHYEHLALFRDELRKREKIKRQKPPAIELGSSEFT